MYENIPEELQLNNNWVNVRSHSKAPINPINLSGASVNKPEHWSTYTQAVKNATEREEMGIGYVFNDGGYVAIDIDCGYDDAGFLTLLAVDIIDVCKSYCEKSRSGRGMHIIVKGELPFAGMNNQKGVEIYKTNRYFIMTGDLMVYGNIIENQQAIDHVVSSYFDLKQTEFGLVKDRLYSPEWKLQSNGKLPINPNYPPVTSGGRNNSLVSLAGQMKTAKYSIEAIRSTLHKVNKIACDPPLPDKEVDAIVRSINRYKR